IRARAGYLGPPLNHTPPGGFAQERQDLRALEPGNPIEKKLAGGEAHSYMVILTAGQFLHVIVDQRGIDVVVALYGPDGQKLTEVDSPNGAQGPEPVFFVSEAAGSYRLEGRALGKNASAGRYEAKITELRAATAQDRSRVAAERAFFEGGQLRAQGTAASLRQALARYEEALTLCRAAGAQLKEGQTFLEMGVISGLL